ncbi:MAG: PTS transporter subunit EIIB [Cellulosilyticaceae bacterium]
MNYQEHKKKMRALAIGYIEKVGGLANIEEVEACSTRIRLILKDKVDINLELLKGLGAKGVLEKGQKEIHIVIGVESEEIVEEIEKLMK